MTISSLEVSLTTPREFTLDIRGRVFIKDHVCQAPGGQCTYLTFVSEKLGFGSEILVKSYFELWSWLRLLGYFEIVIKRSLS